MGLRIFHTSDVHLGMKFAAYPDPARTKLTEARFGTLKRLVDRANDEQCNLFVISGDLFDRVSVSKKDLTRAAQALAEFDGQAVAILPGNHDFVTLGKGDLWSQFKDIAKEYADSNVLVLSEREVYPLKDFDLDANLYPATCDAKHSSTNYIGWIKDTPKDVSVLHHIGIAHGSLEGFSPDLDKQYYPMTHAELAGSGVDLWLMGHTHISYPGKPGAKDRIYYPATPEPDGFDCDHEGMAWIISIDDDKNIMPVRISTGSCRFLHDEVVVSGLDDIKSVKAKYDTGKYSNSLLKLRLKGRLPKDQINDLAELRKYLKDAFLHVEFDDSEVAEEITLDDINGTFTEGSFPYKLLTVLAGEDDQEGLQFAYQLLLEEKKQ